jgi:hypothetical protein
VKMECAACGKHFKSKAGFNSHGPTQCSKVIERARPDHKSRLRRLRNKRYQNKKHSNSSTVLQCGTIENSNIMLGDEALQDFLNSVTVEERVASTEDIQLPVVSDLEEPAFRSTVENVDESTVEAATTADTEVQCAMCRSLIAPDRDIVITSCGHRFHSSCLMRWHTFSFERTRGKPECRCPLCRKHLLSDRVNCRICGDAVSTAPDTFWCRGCACAAHSSCMSAHVNDQLDAGTTPSCTVCDTAIS